MKTKIKIDGNTVFTITSKKNDRGGASISSSLHYCETSEIEENFDDAEDYNKYEAMCDAIESLVLGHFCAGVDVNSKAYVEGLKTALDAIGNQ